MPVFRAILTGYSGFSLTLFFDICQAQRREALPLPFLARDPAIATVQYQMQNWGTKRTHASGLTEMPLTVSPKLVNGAATARLTHLVYHYSSTLLFRRSLRGVSELVGVCLFRGSRSWSQHTLHYIT
jgi:hypothetical protein